MATISEQDAKRWVERSFKLIDGESGDQVARWTVHATGAGMLGKSEQVATVARPGTVAALLSRLHDEATAAEGKVRVKAWFAGARNPASSSRWPRLEDDDEEEGLDGSVASIVRQSLVHNERLMRISSETQGALWEWAGRRVESLEKENEGLRTERVEVFEQVQKVLDRQSERQASLETHTTVVSGVNALVDTLRFKLMGETPKPTETEQALKKALESIGDSISQEEAARLEQVLGSPRFVALSKLLVSDENLKALATMDAAEKKEND